MATHAEKLTLAEELLDDIELSRLGGQPLLLKALRLARLILNEAVETFVRWELHGYPIKGEEEAADMMLRLVGRQRTVKGEDKSLYMSLGGLLAWAEQAEAALATMKIESLSSESLVVVTRELQRSRNRYVTEISRIRQVEAAVVSWLHDMVSEIHNELAFSGQQAISFTALQAAVDSRLATLGGDSLEKIESIYERLNAGDGEAVSHAMSSCRRLINSVADALYPPQDEPILVEGKEVKLTAQQPLNRIETYVGLQISSRSRRKRLRRSLEDLFDRTSAGVHSEVSAAEAKILFLQTYVVLGEIILIGEPNGPDE